MILMNKLINNYILFIKLNLCKFDLIFNEKTYNGLIKILFNLTFIKNVNNYLIYLLEHYSKYTFKNKIILDEKIDYKFTKKLLTIFLVIKFPNSVFTNNTEYNEKLIESSKQIYTILKNLMESKTNKILYSIKLIDQIHQFINIYNLWSMIDKRVNTYSILKMYYKNTIRKFELPKESKLYDVLISSIDNDQKELGKSIKYMNDSNEEHFFNHYKDNLNYNKTIDEKLYLIELKYRLTKTPPDKLVFVELVVRTKEMLKNCVPNRKDHHNIIDNLLDTELMTTYINNGILDNKYFYNIIHIIIDKVKEYQATVEDIELEEFRCKSNGKLDNREFYKNFIPMFFIDIFKRLDKIITTREKFINLINKK
jgi:hypothetical protein